MRTAKPQPQLSKRRASIRQPVLDWLPPFSSKSKKSKKAKTDRKFLSRQSAAKVPKIAPKSSPKPVATRRQRRQLLITLGRIKLSLPPGKRQKLYRRPQRKPAHKLIITLFSGQFKLPFKSQIAASLGLLVIGLVGSLYFGLSIWAAQPRIDDSSYSPPAPITYEVKNTGLSRSVPQQLRVPSVGINSSLVELGRKADGSMEVPVEYHIVGWYRHAPTPGEIGPAVIVGHVDNYQGAAIFYRLKDLQVGEIIEVDRADGRTVKFKVEAVKQFPRDNFPTQEVYGNLDYAGLRLITCGGQFNRQSLSYSHNTVVYASIVN